jgi:hypothetical protein
MSLRRAKFVVLALGKSLGSASRPEPGPVLKGWGANATSSRSTQIAKQNRTAG